MGQGNVTKVVATFVKMLWKLNVNILLMRRFIKSIIDLHVVINVWSISIVYRVRYVVCIITVKVMKNSDTGRMIMKITRKSLRGEVGVFTHF